MTTTCDPKVYVKGKAVCIINSIDSADIEAWVQKLAKATGQKMDWSFFAGYAVVKTLGNLPAALKAADEMKEELNVIGRAKWGRDGYDSYSYVRIKWPDTAEEIATRRKQADEFDEWSDNMLADTEYTVEGRSFELWREWSIQAGEMEWHRKDGRVVHTKDGDAHGRVAWEQIGRLVQQITKVRFMPGSGKAFRSRLRGGWPITVNCNWARIEGHLVMFYKCCSMICHHDVIEDWVVKHTPKSKGSTNESNFQHAFAALGIKVPRC